MHVNGRENNLLLTTSLNRKWQSRLKTERKKSMSHLFPPAVHVDHFPTYTPDTGRPPASPRAVEWPKPSPPHPARYPTCRFPGQDSPDPCCLKNLSQKYLTIVHSVLLGQENLFWEKTGSNQSSWKDTSWPIPIIHYR